MKNNKGFMQMFSVTGVGGGSLDFHVDTHHMMSQTDYGKQSDAKEESKSQGSSVSTDKDGTVHIFENGSELASNNSSYSSYSSSDQDNSGNSIWG